VGVMFWVRSLGIVSVRNRCGCDVSIAIDWHRECEESVWVCDVLGAFAWHREYEESLWVCDVLGGGVR
jgi:hypothetical protein